MSYKTHTAEVFEERLVFLSDPDQFPVRQIRGDRMTEGGLLDGRDRMYVRVTPDGRAWSADHLSLAPQGFELCCERWGDGDRIGQRFSPDVGEFERVGIKPVLCGSAVDA